jgi:ABC-type antimicrobial peptide transport system permease subunit
MQQAGRLQAVTNYWCQTNTIVLQLLSMWSAVGTILLTLLTGWLGACRQDRVWCDQPELVSI